MKKPVPVLKVGDKVTEYNEYIGVLKIGTVIQEAEYQGDQSYVVKFLNDRYEAYYKTSTLRECCNSGHGKYVRYIRPYINGDERRASVTLCKSRLWRECRNAVDKITTMEQCEELKGIFEEIKKEYEDGKKQKEEF